MRMTVYMVLGCLVALTACDRTPTRPSNAPKPSYTPGAMVRQCSEQRDIIYCQQVCKDPKYKRMDWCES